MEFWQNLLISLVSGGGVAAVFLSLFVKEIARKVALEKINMLREEICKTLHEYQSKEGMQLERKSLLEEVERKFLTIYAFREFEKRIDENFRGINKSFDKMDSSLEHITDILLQRN